ncbi:MAG: DUF4097 family beta strand repeat-containing protein [Candidatus Limnocylindrales bacterium]
MTIDVQSSDPATGTGRISSIEHEIGPTGTLVLSVPVGEIEIHAVEGGQVRVRDMGGHGPLLEARTGPGRLAVGLADGVRGRWWNRMPVPLLQVEVPAAARVDIDTTTADIRADGLVGDQRIRSVSGAVRLERGAGRITIDSVSGDVAVDAGAAVVARLRTVSGDVVVRAATFTQLEAHTMSGHIRASGRLLRGAHRMETVSGDAVLVGGADVLAEASTISGDITSDLPHTTGGGLGRRSVRIGSGDARLVFKSMSGDLAILRGDGPSTVPPPAPSPSAESEAARLAILEGLEAGDFDVAEATRRLVALDRA